MLPSVCNPFCRTLIRHSAGLSVFILPIRHEPPRATALRQHDCNAIMRERFAESRDWSDGEHHQSESRRAGQEGSARSGRGARALDGRGGPANPPRCRRG